MSDRLLPTLDTMYSDCTERALAFKFSSICKMLSPLQNLDFNVLAYFLAVQSGFDLGIYIALRVDQHLILR